MHPETDAVSQCSKCLKGLCRSCRYDARGKTICFSCYEDVLHAEIEQARRSTTWVWAFTGGITVIAGISSLAHPGSPFILIVLLAFVFSWCLFWGWMPVWRSITRTIRGCIIGPAILFLIGFIVLIAVAIVIGAGTGIRGYKDARHLVANGDLMLSHLHEERGMRIKKYQN